VRFDLPRLLNDLARVECLYWPTQVRSFGFAKEERVLVVLLSGAIMAPLDYPPRRRLISIRPRVNYYPRSPKRDGCTGKSKCRPSVLRHSAASFRVSAMAVP
jgi:hypothetical protein